MDELKIPSSQEMEKAVLGCMFLDSDAALMGKEALLPEDFYTPLYRTVFEAMQKTEIVTVPMVKNELERMGQWERIGIEWFSKILEGVSTSIYLRKYIEELKRLSFLRKIVSAGQGLIQSAVNQDTEGIDKILSGIQSDGYGMEEGCSFSEALEEYIKKMAEIRASGKSFLGMETGFLDIDDMLGGLRDGTLNIIAARPSMGKSALALDIARNVQKKLTEETEKVVFISLEMSKDEIVSRGYTAEYLIDNDTFNTIGNDKVYLENLRELEKNSADIEKGLGRMWIHDRGGMTMENIRTFCHGLKTKGMQIRLIIVDYLQFVVTKGVNIVQEMGEVSRGLKNLAKDYNCPVIALSQLSRAPEKRADCRPILSDLRESGNIEQDADVVMLLYREEYYFPDIEEHKKRTVEVNIAKQRNGPTGVVKLRWIPECTTFRNLERFHKTNEEPPEGWEDEEE